jgi:mannose-6-phosphate isomerase-like protein (cupin superfamily)
MLFDYKPLGIEYNYLAPDGSEIRLLAGTEAGGLCHCKLGSGQVSGAVKHKTVFEIWYCLSGNGEIWQMKDEKSEVKQFSAGDSFTIPVANAFQFRNTGQEDLNLLIVTIPKWPGPHEAEKVEGIWKLNNSSSFIKS